ncbi:MAG: zinc ribbon domain-containing protein [Dehalococcoidales bacterium]
MGVAKQLYQLQEVDLEIESNEQALEQMLSQLGESQAVAGAQTKLASEQKRLDELRHQQHSTEWEVDDLVTKITATEEQLYSGRIKNPKELTNLQHEVNLLKAKRDQLETRVLETMDQVELAEASVAALSGEFKKLEAEWRNQQQQLTADIETLKSKLSDLKHKRQLLSAEINPQAVGVYDKLRRQKGQAVAKVEQGICRGCRISLPFSELQQARGGNLVQCSNCGRILFLP